MLLRPMFSMLVGYAALSATPAVADELLCNRTQSDCVVRDRRIISGDHVGIFNHDNELVAVGRVERIEGGDRHLQIRDRSGDIRRGYRFARLDKASTDMEALASEYKVYRAPAKVRVHASVGLAGMGVGDGGSGLDATVMGERVWQHDLYYGARAMFVTGGAEVNSHDGLMRNGHLNMLGFGLMPAVSYSYQRRQPWIARVELAPGFMYMAADVDGNSQEMETFVREFSPGFDLLVRGEASIHYRMKQWAPYVSGAAWRYDQMLGGAWNVGITRDIR